ncbi:hypothetical protein ES332_D10G007900v1 [Gossypium tomentosum]|uniref:FAD-binding PCMH-type domain-containing protein n=1 Tax=Gossypium tomentosum TaxID=34277 RepID=A0A5D2IZU2_GOSTO|nr:hypothetical protein ES332_D10G007900v1 [Gossypium tomentosum]
MKISSSIFSLISIFILLLISSATSSDFDDFIRCLPRQSNSSLPITDAILTPNNSTFQSIYQLRANNLRTFLSATSRPVAIITALHPSHAQAAVICAKRHDFQLRIRSGGHDFEGLSYTSDVPFVILDMFNLNSIDIDMSTETAWVQAGATTGELYYRIAEKSNVHGFPSGVCTTLGIGGHFSGGGYGFLIRKYGISIDNVIDAQLIDANGRILSRGGTTSFGIILSWRIKLVRVPPRVTVFTVQRTLEQGVTELAYRWQQVAPKLPKDLFIRLQPEPINNGGNNKTVRVSFIGHFLGQADGLLRLMNVSFPELGLTRNDCLEMSWVESTLYWANFPNGTSIDVLLDRVQENRVFSKSKSDYYKALIPKQGLETLWQGLMDIEDIFVQMNPYGGRMEEISDSETAFAHRAGNLFMMSRRLYDAMAPYASSNPREAFFNYRDLDIGSNESDETDFEDAQEYGAKYFRNNFIRLAVARKRVKE